MKLDDFNEKFPWTLWMLKKGADEESDVTEEIKSYIASKLQEFGEKIADAMYEEGFDGAAEIANAQIDKELSELE